MIEPLLTVEEVGEILKLKKSAVHRLIHSGDLIAVKTSCGGKRPRKAVEPDELRSYIKRNRTGQKKERPTRRRTKTRKGEEDCKEFI